MKLYNYTDSGEFTNETEARGNPVREGDFLIPRNATTIKPPVTSENEVCIFEDGAWTKKPDFRGTVYFLDDGSRHEITEIDTLKPEDALDKAPKLAEPEPQEPPLSPVTRKQLIDVLIEHDLDERVEPALRERITDPKALKKALNAWQNASQYEPDHELVLQLKGALKLKDEQFDAFWREAMAS